MFSCCRDDKGRAQLTHRLRNLMEKEEVSTQVPVLISKPAETSGTGKRVTHFRAFALEAHVISLSLFRP